MKQEPSKTNARMKAMPNIQKPQTINAHEELQGRISVITSQAEEAGRMVGYYTDMAAEQALARDALLHLRASYVGLLEDAGVNIRHEEPICATRNAPNP